MKHWVRESFTIRSLPCLYSSLYCSATSGPHIQTMASFNENVIGPLEITMLIEVAMYGVLIAQIYSYFRAFPNDWGHFTVSLIMVSPAFGLLGQLPVNFTRRGYFHLFMLNHSELQASKLFRFLVSICYSVILMSTLR